MIWLVIQDAENNYQIIQKGSEIPEGFSVVVETSNPQYLDELVTSQAAAAQALQQEIVSQTQARLDSFARTRNYDGILSACTYATSSVPKFQSEGQYAVNARDNTWATLYQILAEVQAGSRPIPTSYLDIESDLPVLEWPDELSN